MIGTHYYFLPYLRTGLASLIRNNPAPGKHRSSLNINVGFDAHKIASDIEQKIVSKEIHLYGPGDVPSFNYDMIKGGRTPRNDAGDFEPNYFPSLLFRDADYPWRYTPSIANGSKLIPWLTLVVLRAESKGDKPKEFEEAGSTVKEDSAENKRPRFIRNVNVGSLPDLNNVWRWAHVQITSKSGVSINEQTVKQMLADHPEQVMARIMCARRLQPGVLYNAFVVPTFKLSLYAAGLLESKSEIEAADLAWDNASNDLVQLPYFDRWEFRTSERGDFEHLVRQLEARKLSNVGKREVDCSDPGFNLSGISRDIGGAEPVSSLGLEGALKAEDMIRSQWGMDQFGANVRAEPFRQELANLLNYNTDYCKLMRIEIPSLDKGIITVGDEKVEVTWTTSELSSGRVKYGVEELNLSAEEPEASLDHKIRVEGLEPEKQYSLCVEIETIDGNVITSDVVTFSLRETKPLVAPHIYGRWHLKRDHVSSDVSSNDWLDELNLDPRHRAAAGIGAAVVRKNQEALMESAWDQVGEIEQANTMLNQAALATEVSGKIFQRLQKLSDEDFILITRGIHQRIMGSSSTHSSVAKFVDSSRIPNTALDGAFRRLRRPYGIIRKRQYRQMGNIVPQKSMISRFNGKVDSEARDLLNVAPKRANPGGLISRNDVYKELMSSSNSSILFSSNIAPIVWWNITPEKLRFEIDSGNFSGKDVKVAESLTGLINSDFATPSSQAVQPENFLNISVLNSNLKERLLPGISISERLRSLLDIDGYDWQNGTPDMIMYAPEFPQAMYQSLLKESKEWLIPGIGNIPDNTVAALQTNRFIEAFMCGCNHEFSAELLWRGYPTDQRGTYFRRFWDYEAEGMDDIRPIHQWSATRLGNNIPSSRPSEIIVLLIRGELLKRYPNSTIYLVKSDVDPSSGKIMPELDEFWPENSYFESPRKYPIFSAVIPDDISLLGFGISKTALINEKWFFVIEERVSEARFGMDVSDIGSSTALTKWDDLSWGHIERLDMSSDDYIDDKLPQINAGEWEGSNHSKWDDSDNTSSASIANITLQKPARIVISAKTLIGEKSTW